MNYPKIEPKEYLERVNALRKKMNEVARYYCGFAQVNESSAFVIPAEGDVIVCSGQASYDYCLVQNKLPQSRIAIR